MQHHIAVICDTTGTWTLVIPA